MHQMNRKNFQVKKRRVAAYLWVPLDVEQASWDSLEAQQNKIGEFLESSYGTNCEFVRFYIEGQGNTGYQRFSTYERLQSDIAGEEINTVICTKLNGIVRSIVDLSNLWEFLEWSSVDFISLKEGLDSSTLMGRTMLESIVNMARMERGLEI